MNKEDYFKPGSSWFPDEVRDFLREREAGTYNLLDVRQPVEYQEGHIPGAKLIPLGRLTGQLKELTPGVPTIVYCSVGGRSRVAASMLSRAGFRDVHNMEGGFEAWEGNIARGMPQTAEAYFAPGRSLEEYVALAWWLEDGTQEFFQTVRESAGDAEARDLYESLIAAEDRHKSSLLEAYEELRGKKADPGFPASAVRDLGTERWVEGGVRLEEVLEWSKGRPLSEVIEFSMVLEANSYDRYLLLQSNFEESSARNLFSKLAREEKLHLERLTEAFEKLL